MNGPATPSESGLRIAVVFFGITRSLRLTIGSIRKNILDPAHEIAGTMRTFGHFFTQDRIDSPRSREHGPLDLDEYRLLNLDEVEFEPPDLCLDLYAMDSFKAAGDPWKDGFQSLRNVVHQLHSLDRVTTMAKGWDPDIVVFARPDLYYHDAIAGALIELIRSKGNRIIVPDWAEYFGHNDRFAIARGPQAIEAFGQRVHRLKDYCDLGHAPHAERFLKHALSDTEIRKLPLRVSRVRSNGLVRVENFSPGRGGREPHRYIPFVDFERQWATQSPDPAGKMTGTS